MISKIDTTEKYTYLGVRVLGFKTSKYLHVGQFILWLFAKALLSNSQSTPFSDTSWPTYFLLPSLHSMNALKVSFLKVDSRGHYSTTLFKEGRRRPSNLHTDQFPPCHHQGARVTHIVWAAVHSPLFRLPLSSPIMLHFALPVRFCYYSLYIHSLSESFIDQFYSNICTF